MKSHDEKSLVQVRLVSIEGKEGKSDVGNIKVTWERGDSNGTTKVFSVGEEVNEEFSFTSTFQYSKTQLKPKLLKLNFVSRNATIGSETINLSDYFKDVNNSVEQEIVREILFGKEKGIIKLIILFGDGVLSAPKVNKTKTRIMSNNSPTSSASKLALPASYSTPKRKAPQGAISINRVAASKTSFDLSESMNLDSRRMPSPSSSLMSKPESTGETLIIHRTMRSTDRIHRSTADASQIRAALDQPTTLSSSSIARQGSFRQTKSPLRDGSSRELKSGSRRSTIEPLTEEEEILIKDIGRHSSFMELEEKCKCTDNTLLAQIIYTSMPIEKFTSNSGLPEIILTQLHTFVTADILPLKLCVYLFSSITKLITLYESLSKKQRVETMVQFCEDLQKIGSKCYVRLIEMINLKLHKACEQSFSQNCSDKPILQELNSLVKLTYEFRLLIPFKTAVLNDVFKILNIAFYDEIVKDHCTLMIGIQLQMMIGMISDFEYKLKNLLILRDNLVIIKEIGRVLVLSQKNLLLDDARSDICPHLTDEILVKLLTNYDKLNPKEIPAGTISLLSRNANQQRTEFFDFTLPELKDQRMKDVIKDAIGCPWTPFDFSNTPLASRPYLIKQQQ